VYYLGISSGGNLGKQIALLGAISSMAKGMLYRFKPHDSYPDAVNASYKKIQDGVDELILLTDMLDKYYVPMLDTNPYMFQKARRLRKGVHITEVLAFSIIEEHNLVSGNIMRARLVDQFGKKRIMTEPDEGQDGY
jgi:hypothetical protein